MAQQVESPAPPLLPAIPLVPSTPLGGFTTFQSEFSSKLQIVVGKCHGHGRGLWRSPPCSATHSCCFCSMVCYLAILPLKSSPTVNTSIALHCLVLICYALRWCKYCTVSGRGDGDLRRHFFHLHHTSASLSVNILSLWVHKINLSNFWFPFKILI